ncbi:MAG: hypothetical protein SGILL_004907, partial [Bacillariaceae sp.]
MMKLTFKCLTFLAVCLVLAPVANAALYEESTEQDAASAPAIDQRHRELLKQKKSINKRQQDCDRLALEEDDEEFRQLEEMDEEEGVRNLSYIRSPNTVKEAFAEAMDRGGYGVAGAGSGISKWGKKGSSSSSVSASGKGSGKGSVSASGKGSGKGSVSASGKGSGKGSDSGSSGKKGGDDDDDDAGGKKNGKGAGSGSGGKKGGDDDDDSGKKGSSDSGKKGKGGSSSGGKKGGDDDDDSGKKGGDDDDYDHAPPTAAPSDPTVDEIFPPVDCAEPEPEIEGCDPDWQVGDNPCVEGCGWGTVPNPFNPNAAAAELEQRPAPCKNYSCVCADSGCGRSWDVGCIKWYMQCQTETQACGSLDSAPTQVQEFNVGSSCAMAPSSANTEVCFNRPLTRSPTPALIEGPTDGGMIE